MNYLTNQRLDWGLLGKSVKKGGGDEDMPIKKVKAGGEKYIISVVLENIKNNGPLRRAITKCGGG